MKPCPICNEENDVLLTVTNNKNVWSNGEEENWLVVTIRCYNCGLQVTNTFYPEPDEGPINEKESINSIIKVWNKT